MKLMLGRIGIVFIAVISPVILLVAALGLWFGREDDGYFYDDH